MSPSLIHEPIANLALWQDGFARGRDVGISTAMHAITRERVHQQQLADGARELGRYVYADDALHQVAKALGRRFWQ